MVMRHISLVVASLILLAVIWFIPKNKDIPALRIDLSNITDYQEPVKNNEVDPSYLLWKDVYELGRNFPDFRAKIVEVDGVLVVLGWSSDPKADRGEIQKLLLEKISPKHPEIYASVAVSK